MSAQAHVLNCTASATDRKRVASHFSCLWLTLWCHAVYPKCPTAVTVLSTVATPFIPFTTSAANTLAMESLFLRRAISNDKLRGPHLAHCSAAGAGLALFALDEFRPHLPCVHAGWHILSSLAVRETLPLIQTSEQPSERCRQGFATAVWNKSGCLSSSLKV